MESETQYEAILKKASFATSISFSLFRFREEIFFCWRVQSENTKNKFVYCSQLNVVKKTFLVVVVQM
jgi:hypothetical protein